MSSESPNERQERFQASIPIWVRLPLKAEAILLVILVPTLYISSLEPTGILGLTAGVASSTLVLMVVIAFVPVIYAIVWVLRRGYTASKELLVGAISR